MNDRIDLDIEAVQAPRMQGQGEEKSTKLDESARQKKKSAHMKVVLKEHLRAQRSDILAKISTNNPYVSISKK